MKLLAFNFEKILVERLAPLTKEVHVGINVDLSDISEVKAEIISPEGGVIGVRFKFNVEYGPELAKVELKGHFLVEVSKELLEDTLKGWKGNNLSEEIRLSLVNLIVEKSTLKALELEEQTGLPLHYPMPSYKKD